MPFNYGKEVYPTHFEIHLSRCKEKENCAICGDYWSKKMGEELDHVVNGHCEDCNCNHKCSCFCHVRDEDLPRKVDVARWCAFWGMNSRSTLNAEQCEIFQRLKKWREGLSDEQERMIQGYVESVANRV